MWRFKPSKYKNSVPKIPKKDGWITDISVGSLPSFGNHIKASATLVAFNVDSGGGGNLGVLSLNETGSKSRDLSILYGHSDFITDFDFCPFDDEILATGSQDHHIKLWRLTENTVKSNIPCNPEVDILASKKIEVLKFNPQVDCVIAAVEESTVRLWDVNNKQSIYDSSHSDVIQSICWKQSGNLLASCGKDKKLCIWDPRDTSKSQVVESHGNNRDSRVVWIGDTDQLITTGFGSGREREVFLRDIRKLEEPVASYSGDSSLGVYIPLFDPDTNMLFLVAKADTTISFWEVLDHAPFLQEATKHLGDVQAKGAALVPKRALQVLDGEVNRVLLLGQNCIVPISFQVPRKSYRDFHADLFPDTCAPEPSLTSAKWQAGEQTTIMKVSLDPSKSGKLLIKANHDLGSGPRKEVLYSIEKSSVLDKCDENNSFVKEINIERNDSTNNKSSKPAIARKPSPPIKPKPLATDPDPPSSPKSMSKSYVQNLKNTFNAEKPVADTPAKSPATNRKSIRSFGMRVSKFRHLNGNIFPKEFHITDLPTLTRTIPGESNGFDANEKRVALPIGAAGNFLGIMELSDAGRSPVSSDMPGLLVTSSIMDFCWDPFDPLRIAVACDSGDVQIWVLPEEGLRKKLRLPFHVVNAHSEKVSVVKFNPCAKDVIATASSDLTIRVWDLAQQEEKFRLVGHTDQILHMAWSTDGRLIATVSKDQKLRIFDPRTSSVPIQEGPGPQGTRGARLVWVLNSKYLVVTGFSKVSERQIYLYDCKDLSSPIGDIGLDVSPATLVPHFDEDSSTLFLTGKGDSVIFAYEVALDTPYFHQLSHYKCTNPHQSLSFLPKYVCNVREVEFARAVRLTASALEPISFHVPRLRTEYFQDDLFPPTLKTWEPSMSSSEWCSGLNKPLQTMDMRPEEMELLSEAPPPAKTIITKPSNPTPQIAFEGEVVLQSSLAFLQNTKEKEEKIMQSMSSQCEIQYDSLPQEKFEGVDPDEWDEEEKEHSQNIS